ncbi:hypothetical protein HanHA300_Chr16g0622531 [Helianthus annuus]|nr:hypothetical protein HanHA300_Chr16g0622531 [Helianthus annuus]KAJ0461543.1 hypothetical protein HanHA89_Chr16g0673421 [Helianthus annuus]KAJ0641970.1 hypothetical protein HanLR1_Chr16g0633081 [Helianthus annuus]
MFPLKIITCQAFIGAADTAERRSGLTSPFLDLLATQEPFPIQIITRRITRKL